MCGADHVTEEETLLLDCYMKKKDKHAVVWSQQKDRYLACVRQFNFMFSVKSFLSTFAMIFATFLIYKCFHCLNQILDLEVQYGQHHEDDVKIIVWTL